MRTAQDIYRILLVGFISLLEMVLGNLISIGPGSYESNHTLDGSARAVYVLNSCEFMHNGRLHSVHFYAGSEDWLAIQIWRPFGGGSSSGRMKLVYQKYMDVKAHPDIYQVQFDTDEVHVKSGDLVGFTKLNDSFPISYIFHPLQSVDIWYHNIDMSQDYPQLDDVIDFEEMGFPYRFSVTVRFWADIISPNNVNSDENTLLDSDQKLNYKDWTVKGKHKGKEEGLRYVYNVTDEQHEEINLDSKVAKVAVSINTSFVSQESNITTFQSTNETAVTQSRYDHDEKTSYSNSVSSASSTINSVDTNTEASTDKFMASTSHPNIGKSSSTPFSTTGSILNKGEEEYSVSSMDSETGSTVKPQIDKKTVDQDSYPSLQNQLNKSSSNITKKP